MLNPSYIIHQFHDKDMLDRAAADYWLNQARQAINERGAFHVALTGGSSPQAMYRLLASEHYASQINWSKVHIYIGDERYVPHAHPESNYGMAKDCLLDQVDIPAGNLHPIPTDEQQAEQAAARYARELQKWAPLTNDSLPQLDLIMLGMGDDGHTASLFPDTDILSVTDKSVAAVYVARLASQRISMTYPTLNNARQIMFIVCGGNKAGILSHVLQQGSQAIYPIQAVQTRGEMHWFVDQAAAGELT